MRPRTIEVVGDEARVPLADGGFAVIDAEDVGLAQAHNWRRQRGQNGIDYACAYGPDGHIWLHRLIAGAPDDCLVDHHDRDGLNNRRSNLRWATPPQNQQNKIAPQGCRSRFKGVQRAGKTFRWKAMIRVRGAQVYIGTFRREEDAARAYDQEARRFFGEFARTNADLGLLDGR